ncbi:MAG: hypothetical protein KME22_00820 [Hassallia sp. WJT32-NPBG1]|nr:hypothetical protein [Hassallia sp. WJT32-NPBG1]
MPIPFDDLPDAVAIAVMSFGMIEYFRPSNDLRYFGWLFGSGDNRECDRCILLSSTYSY